MRSGPDRNRAKGEFNMRVRHDLFKFTTVHENAGGPRFVGAAVATVNENDLSTSERSIENSPALQRWVDRSSRLSPVGTAESSPYLFHSSLRDLLPFVTGFPALKRWAIFKCSYGAHFHRSAP